MGLGIPVLEVVRSQVSTLLFLFFSFSIFAQEEDSDFEEFDDFDSMFEVAEDVEEAVVEEKTSDTASGQIFSSAFSSVVHFSGAFTADVGLAYINKAKENEEADYRKYMTYMSR